MFNDEDYKIYLKVEEDFNKILSEKNLDSKSNVAILSLMMMKELKLQGFDVQDFVKICENMIKNYPRIKVK